MLLRIRRFVNTLNRFLPIKKSGFRHGDFSVPMRWRNIDSVSFYDTVYGYLDSNGHITARHVCVIQPVELYATIRMFRFSHHVFFPRPILFTAIPFASTQARRLAS